MSYLSSLSLKAPYFEPFHWPMFILGIFVLCFVVPAMMYPCLFTRPQPSSAAEQRLMAEGRRQYEEEKARRTLLEEKARKARRWWRREFWA
jgi:hypothetical protein